MDSPDTRGWFSVRESTELGGSVVIGRVTWTERGWIAWDDRHGAKRVSLHERGEDAVGAVRLRAKKSEQELDRETATLVDGIRELRGLLREVDAGRVRTERLAEILARANEIGRLWDA